MKHFFGYTTDGVLWWQVVMTGGHPDGCNVDDPDCTNPQSQAIRAAVEAAQDNKTLGGIVEFICPCASDVGMCDCTASKRATAYYCTINNCLTDKPATQVLVNGVPVENGDSITKTPGSTFTVKVTGNDVPDDEAADLLQTMLHPDSPIPLTFTGGVSTEVTLTAPAQGLTGSFSVDGKYVCPVTVHIKAFA